MAANLPRQAPHTGGEQSTQAADTSRLRWLCRRGTREADLLLQGFLAADYPQLDSAGRSAFGKLLQCTDADILDWVGGRNRPPPELAAIVARVQALARPA